jgi:ubiquinone/menaquinone biosynthesis C-methylase UbiE
MLSREYAKVCELEDFTDPRVASAIADIAPRLAARPPERKAWEYAMAALFLDEVGHLHDGSRVLDVGAGADPILYWLANRTGETVGIDIYGEGGFADREGELLMLDDPDSHAPYAYARDRLTMLAMDARSLDFPDAAFDAVVSFSSIEHFGGPSGISAAAREIGRVLRPGGHAFIVTEVFVDYGLLARPSVQAAVRAATLGRRWRTATLRQRAWPEVLTKAELRRWIVEPTGLELMQPLRTAVSSQTRAQAAHLRRDGTRAPGAEKRAHVLLSILGSTFTSVGLPLAKRA